MNNSLNAKLSKLVYAPMPDDAAGIAQTERFDRFILLIRRIYQTIDEAHGLTQVTLRIRCDGRQGLVTLDAATSETDSGSLRLKRWGVYAGIAKHVAGCQDLSAALEHIAVEGAAQESYYAAAVGEMIARFGLAGGAVPAPSAHPAAGEQQQETPKQSIKSIIAYRGKSLSRIGTQAKTESYKAQSAPPSLRISRLNFGGYKQK